MTVMEAPFVARLDVGKVDPPVLRVVGVKGHVHEAAVLNGPHLGQPGDRLGGRLARGQEAKPARSLGHEHAPVRQEGHAPRRVEPLGHELELERELLALDHLARLWPARSSRSEACLGALFADVRDETEDLTFREGRLEGRHRALGASFPDARGDALVVCAEGPAVVHQALRSPAAKIRAVTGCAVLGVDVRDAVRRGRGLGELGTGEGAGQCGEGREGKDDAGSGSLHGLRRSLQRVSAQTTQGCQGGESVTPGSTLA